MYNRSTVIFTQKECAPVRMIFRYLKPFVPRMSLGLTIKFIGSVMDLLLPWILSYMIDEVAPTGDMGLVAIWGGAMIGAAAHHGEDTP